MSKLTYSGGHLCAATPPGWRIAYAPRGTPGPKGRLQKRARKGAPFTTVAVIRHCPWCADPCPDVSA